MTPSLSVRALLAVAALGAAPLVAPRALDAQQVIQPSSRQTLDPARTLVRRDLLALSDSLLLVQAAIARFERDTHSPSDGVQLGRARSLARACRSAQRQVEPTHLTVRGTKLPPAAAEAGSTTTASAHASLTRRQEALAKGFAPLLTSLTACDSTFAQMTTGPNAAGTVRDWGLYRAHKVRDQLNQFQRLVNDFLAAAGIRVTPPSLNAGLEG